jgi:DNA-binding NarL/FixJ family response regulator
MDHEGRTSVFLLTENRLLGETLSRILQKKTDIHVSGSTAFSVSALAQVATDKPDIALLDSTRQTGPGLGTCSLVAQASPGVKVILVGMDHDESAFLAAVGEGVIGYVLKDASALEIVAAVRAVARGEAVCPPGLSSALFRCAARQASTESSRQFRSDFGLSARQQQLVHLIRLGLTNKEIAARLNLSEQTIKNHVHRILQKVGASDRRQILKCCESASREEPLRLPLRTAAVRNRTGPDERETVA